MKVIFVSFQDNTDIIGVKYLHAYIVSKGYDSSILLVPNYKPHNIKTAVDYIVKNKPDAICFSAMSYEFKMAKDFANILKGHFNGCPVIFGGIHATADPESCLDIADIVVRGEGEDTLLALLQLFQNGTIDNIDQVKSIVFKHNGRIVHTSNRGPIHDLNALPYPRHLPDSMFVVHQGRIRSVKESIMYKRYARYQGVFLTITSSRGCPFSCNYCCNSLLKSLYGKSSIRTRSVESVIDEIVKEIHDFDNVLYVNFQDDCFITHSLDWIEEFSREYLKEVNIPFVVRSTPKHINKEKMMYLRKAGLRWLFMGLQTGSDRINREVYGRYATSDDFLKGAKIVSDLKISPWYDVILDNPYETEEDHLETINVLLRTPRPFQLGLFSLDYFPGTQLWQRVLKDKIPIPELGAKSYMQPEAKMINHYIRMCATLPPVFVRLLVSIRKTLLGKLIGLGFYLITLILEPFMYVWLVYNSNDFKLIRTIKVVKAFYLRSINKLFLRKIA